MTSRGYTRITQTLRLTFRGDIRRAIFDRSGPLYITGTRVTFYVPFTGDSELFKCHPSTFSLSPPRATISRSSELVFTYDLTKEQTSGVKGTFERDLDQTLVHAERINAEVMKFNTDLPEHARQRLDARREKLLQDRNLVESIGFPLRRTQNPPSTFVTPDVKRRVSPQKPRASSEPFRPEPTLEMGEYEYILSILSNMTAVMERSPSEFKGMREETLRSHFLVHLNGHYEGQATGETFNYEGKTDILIRTDGRNIFHRRVQVLDRTGRTDQGTKSAARLHSLARYENGAPSLQSWHKYVYGFGGSSQDHEKPSKLQEGRAAQLRDGISLCLWPSR